MSKSGEPAPSAPLPENSSSTNTPPTYPAISSDPPAYEHPREQADFLRAPGPAPGFQTAPAPGFHTNAPDQSSVYDQPPPSYQDAVNYPTYPAEAMPKPYTPQQQNPPPMHAVYPGDSHLGGPPPPNQSHPHIVHTIITTQALPGSTCVWCRAGIVRNETDLCCLICLILLAICTFPVGLILLCCIPCTVRPRCSVCRRLQD